MTKPLTPDAPLLQQKRETADRDLSQRYFELLKLRQQVRVAQCGRVAVQAEQEQFQYSAQG